MKINTLNNSTPEKIHQSIIDYEQSSDKNSIIIPQRFKEVIYKGNRIPGVTDQSNLSLGANCQVFVYEFLKTFDIDLPNFRSSELWEDKIYTIHVDSNFLPFDIVLFNNKAEAFGAHLGLHLGKGKILHLSKDNGNPRIETIKTMQLQLKYTYVIGAKRALINAEKTC